ncbi:MAG: DNA polymerase/3'-5' exonuclease PolX [Anaerolineae bacterium]|nr:DNA polymerase/3'-5' exonuclease PolX [Anaerolineae bacterium]
MKNRDVVDTFNQIADMLAIRGDQIHRILAYRRAAESIETLGRDINTVYAEGKLTEIPGIGDTLAAKIEEMLTTGKLEFYEKLAKDVPPSLVDMMRVEGLGPKRVKQIHDLLGISTMAELTAAAREGKLRELPGMGVKSEAKLLSAIEALSVHGDSRVPLGVAWPIAQQMLDALQQVPGVTRAAVGGSLRRMKDTIGDIDLLVAAESAEQVMDRFVQLDLVETVDSRGPTRARVTLLTGLGVDLRVLPIERWGTLMAYFTGNKDHNVKLREMALKMGYSLSEYSFTPLDGGAEILCASEEEVYSRLGLAYIPPTLREDRGEIEAAKAKSLPVLIELEDIRSDLHMHTEWSDGKYSVMEMAKAAREQGLDYIALTDHSASLGIANGLSVERLRQRAVEVKEANDVLGPKFRVLQGTEMEIRADGSLDYPDDVLEELDFVIASLHTGLSQPREQVTQRMLSAINNPHVDMIAHPTGRLLPDRPGADLDMDAIIAAAAATGTILEINANPARLDLRDVHARMAIEHGVKIAINTDAHQPEDFGLRHFGVATAQRGWVTASDVVNTWPLEQFLDYISRNNG